MKVALIIASGCKFAPEELEVSEAHAHFATRLVKLLVNNTCARVLRNVHENPYEKNLHALLAKIEKAGHKGISRTDLTRAFQSIKSVELSEILDRLQETGEVLPQPISPGPKGGRPGIKLVARTNLPPATPVQID